MEMSDILERCGKELNEARGKYFESLHAKPFDEREMQRLSRMYESAWNKYAALKLSEIHGETAKASIVERKKKKQYSNLILTGKN